MYDNRIDEQSQFTTVLALDNVQVTPWEFLRTRRRKSRTAAIDTNAIIMDFQVERHAIVTNEDQVDEARRGGSLSAETQRGRSGSDR